MECGLNPVHWLLFPQKEHIDAWQAFALWTIPASQERSPNISITLAISICEQHDVELCGYNPPSTLFCTVELPFPYPAGMWMNRPLFPDSNLAKRHSPRYQHFSTDRV
uniref:Uncharacterized protein n=1 Tax=Chelativorans sp. (strain BNC1) TaxID=266779 RepID=Q11CM7_CHESB